MTEYHSVHCAPDSRMNRMEEMRFTRNSQNMRYSGKFLAENPTRPPCRVIVSLVVRNTSKYIVN